MYFGRTRRDFIKDSVKKFDWEKLDKNKVVREINNQLEFLLRDYVVSIVQEAMVSEDVLNECRKLLPEVFLEVNVEKREIILEALVTETSVHKTYNVADMVITSFRWGLEEIEQALLKSGNKESIEEYIKVLNSIGDELANKEYYKLVRDVQQAKITTKGNFGSEDIESEVKNLDIVSVNAIKISSRG